MIVVSEDEFFHDLLQGFPRLESLHAEHVEFYEEFLSHVFLADVVRWIVGLFGEGGESSEGNNVGLRLITFVEDSYAHGDCVVRELIRVSFVENLPYPGQDGFRVHEFLRGNLLRMYAER